MKLQVTKDPKEICFVTLHPDLINNITDDESSSLTKEEYEEAVVGTMKDNIYINVYTDNGEIAGLFNCHDSEGALEVHINMLPKYRGKFAIEAANACKDLIFSKTEYTKILTRVPSKFMNVFKFVTKLGFKLEYMIENEYKKNGQEYDLYCFSLSKG